LTDVWSLDAFSAGYPIFLRKVPWIASLVEVMELTLLAVTCVLKNVYETLVRFVGLSAKLEDQVEHEQDEHQAEEPAPLRGRRWRGFGPACPGTPRFAMASGAQGSSAGPTAFSGDQPPA
jgi:hypothetical protein